MKGQVDEGLKYVQSLNIRVVKSYSNSEKFLTSKLGNTKARECLAWFEKRGASLGRNPEEESEYAFYAFKNQTLQQSKAISELFDADYIRRICTWISNNREFFGNRILDIGCDNGIITCFIAKLFPESEIVGIDRCFEAVEIARELAGSMNLTNVTFFNESCEHFSEGKFSCVFSSRVSQETINKPSCNLFDSFWNISSQYKNNLLPYIHSLVRNLDSDSTLILCDMIGIDPYYYGQLRCISQLHLVPIFGDQLTFSSFEDTINLSIVVSQFENDLPDIPDTIVDENPELLKPYVSNKYDFFARAFFVDYLKEQKIQLGDCQYTGWFANLLLDDNAKDLLLGYRVYFKNTDNPIMLSLWSNSKDETALIYFGPNENGERSWTNMDMSQKDEAIHTIRERIKACVEMDSIEYITVLNVQNGAFMEKRIAIEDAINDTVNPLSSIAGLTEFIKDQL